MLKALAAQFPYLEICGVRKWGKTKEKGGPGYEASACFMARYVGKKYQFKSLGRSKLADICSL
jgi:hypothetical protein